jgi:hypothetical protein
MELDRLLQVMDRAAANLAKLDAVWERAEPMIPTEPAFGSTTREYDDLRRSWKSLLGGLPPIDGWKVTVELPDADEKLGSSHFRSLMPGTLPVGSWTSIASGLRRRGGEPSMSVFRI